MKQVKTKLLTILLMATLLSVGFLGYYFGARAGYVADETEPWLTQPLQEASYIIGRYNTTHYYARNSTGYGTAANLGYEMLSTDATQIATWCEGNMTHGGTILFKAGRYDIQNWTIANKKFLKIEGEAVAGRDISTYGTMFRATGTGAHLSVTDNSDYFQIENIGFNAAAIANVSGAALIFNKASHFTVKSCTFYPWNTTFRYGVGISVSNNSYFWTIDKVLMRWCDTGILINGTTNACNDGTITDLTQYFMTNYGIRNLGCKNIWMEHIALEQLAASVAGISIEALDQTLGWAGLCSIEDLNIVDTTYPYDGIYLKSFNSTFNVRNVVIKDGRIASQRYGVNISDYCQEIHGYNIDFSSNPSGDVIGLNNTGVSKVTFENCRNFVTKNSGTATIASGENVAHGIDSGLNIGQANSTVLVTAYTVLYDSVPVVVGCNSTDGTNIKITAYWTNGTEITTDAIIVWWKVTYP